MSSANKNYPPKPISSSWTTQFEYGNWSSISFTYFTLRGDARKNVDECG